MKSWFFLVLIDILLLYIAIKAFIVSEPMDYNLGGNILFGTGAILLVVVITCVFLIGKYL